MKQFCLYWLPVLFLATVIFVQSSFPSPKIMPSFPFADKLLHGLVYGVLAALCYRALRRTGPMADRGMIMLALTAIAMATLYGASDEWHQSFIAERTADRFDLLADFIGSIIGTVTYSRLVKHLKPRGNSHSLIDKLYGFL
jgi:VanZ family protein